MDSGGLLGLATPAVVLLALVALLVAGLVFLDWRRGVYLVAVVLPFESLIGWYSGIGFKLIIMVALFGLVADLAARPSRDARLGAVLAMKPSLLLATLALWALCSALWAKSQPAAISAAASWAGALVLMVLVALLSPAETKRAWVLLAWSGVASVGVALAAGVGSVTVGSTEGRIAAPYADPNEYAGLLVVVALVCAYGLTGRWRFPALMVLIVGILASGSRGSAIAGIVVAILMAGIVFYGKSIGTRRRGFVVFVTASVAAFAALSLWAFNVVPTLQSMIQSRAGSLQHLSTVDTFVARVRFWRVGYHLFLAHPLLGVGADNFPIFNPEVEGVQYVAHNMFVDVGAELGIVGILLFLGFLGSLIRSAGRLGRTEPLGLGMLAGLLAACGVGMSLSTDVWKLTYFLAGSTLALLAAASVKDRGAGQDVAGEELALPPLPPLVRGRRNVRTQ